MGATQRGGVSRHFPKDSKIADRSMDKGAPGSYSGTGNTSGQSVTPIPNPPKEVAKSYAYKDGIGSGGKGQGIPKGGKTGLQ